MVPHTPQGTERVSQAWKWWLAGGCIFLLLALMAGAGIGVFVLYRSGSGLISRLQHGDFTCLPSGFPIYPRSQVFNEHYQVNGPTPGAACTMVYDTNDGVAGVMSFYTNKLDTGEWQVEPGTVDPAGNVITFRNLKTGVTGRISATGKGDQTEFTIQTYG